MQEHSEDRFRDRQEILAFLGALSLFLSAVEYLVPKPLPFLRLGLANLPIILGLGFLNVKDIFVLFLLKVLGQGLVNGTLASHVFLFSFSGSLVSVLVMYLASRGLSRYLGFTGLSVLGAMASSLVQATLSLLVVFGTHARPLVPLALGSALAAGVLTGLFAQHCWSRSTWLKAVVERYRGEGITQQAPTPDMFGERSSGRGFRDRIGEIIDPLPRFLGCLAVLVPYIMMESILPKSILVCLFAVLTVLSGKRIRWLYFFIVSLSVVFFQLLLPWGRVLVELGSFRITGGALESGILRALTLCGLVFLSVSGVHRTLYIPGPLGRLWFRCFYYFEQILGSKSVLKKKKVSMAVLDGILWRRFDPGNIPDSSRQYGSNWKSVRGWWICLLLAGLVWLLWILELQGVF